MNTVEDIQQIVSATTLQGHEANGFESTLKAADLNWQVEEDSVSGSDSGVVMPRKKMLYRSDTKEALGIVGEEYNPSSPHDFLKTQYEFAEFLGARVTRAGFMKERSRAFAFIDLGKLEIPVGKRKVGDPISAHLYSTDGWDGGTANESRLYIERLICTNGMTSRKLHSRLWIPHTKNRDSKFKPRWTQFLGEIKEQMLDVQEQFKSLAATRFTQKQMENFVEKLIPGDSTQAKNRRETVAGLFRDGIGNSGQTKWDAFNAVTEYVTHHKGYRGNDNTPVEVNRFIGVMEKNRLSEQALALLN